MFQFCLFKSKKKTFIFCSLERCKLLYTCIRRSSVIILSSYAFKTKGKNLIHVLFYIKMQGIFAQSKNKVAAWWSSFPKPYLGHKSKENLYTFYLFSTLTKFLIFIYIKYLLNIYFLH